MQTIISNQGANPPHQYPACIVWFSDLGLSQREMSRITGVSQCAILKSYGVFVRAAILPRAMWADIDDNRIKIRPYPHLYHEAKEFSFNAQADQTNRMPCLCSHGPRTFSSS